MVWLIPGTGAPQSRLRRIRRISGPTTNGIGDAARRTAAVPAPRTRLDAALAPVLELPAAVLGAVALITLLVIVPMDGGYPAGKWYPAALFAVGLLLVGVLALPRARAAAVPVRVACVALVAYAAWSYLSIAWADQQGDAWDGANRTALYAILFALFALWPVR